MNTYYLRKFRRAANKYVKFELYKHDDFDEESIVIATSDDTPKAIAELMYRMPVSVYRWLDAHDIFRLSPKQYYARINCCNTIGIPKIPIMLDDMTYEERVQHLHTARREFIRQLVYEERKANKRRKDYYEQQEEKRQRRATIRQLRRL